VRAAAVTVSRAGANPPAATNCREGAGPARHPKAEVAVDGQVIGQSGPGLLILVCAMQGDTEAEAEKLAAKIAKLRIFQDEAGKMNRSLLDTGGGALVVSQFTLAADTPAATAPAFPPPPRRHEGERLYRTLRPRAGRSGPKVETGAFGADMAVTLTNDGPVTIWLDTEA
jgi:D-tyrosyl-tRNA(Tyr) deacylase